MRIRRVSSFLIIRQIIHHLVLRSLSRENYGAERVTAKLVLIYGWEFAAREDCRVKITASGLSRVHKARIPIEKKSPCHRAYHVRIRVYAY